MNRVILLYSLYHINMESTRDNMNKEAEIAFKEFSKNISYCIFNRILGIVSLLLIIASSVCLLLCYWLLTGSKYVEHIMIDICADLDLFYFQTLAKNTIKTVYDTINSWTGSRTFVSKTNIKSEFTTMFERHLAPDWANEMNEDLSLSNETSSNSSTSSIKLSENSNNNSDEESSSGEESSGDEEVKNINSNLIHDFGNDVEDVTQQISHENETRESDLKLVNEIEDITEQVLAEREENKVVVDLISESEEEEDEKGEEEDDSEKDDSEKE